MKDSSSRRAFVLSGLGASIAIAQERGSRPVRFRTIGKTGLRVTELGFGSEEVSDTSVFARALDRGINFFDTARSYQGGNAEPLLGAALKGRRNSVVLASRSYAPDAKTAAAHLEDSLKALGTDHLDIWYIGQKDKPEAVTPDLLEVQYAAQRAGKIRFRGISSHRVGAMVDTIIQNRFDVVQIGYNFAIGTRHDPFHFDSASVNASLDKLKAAGIGVVAMKVMAGGYRDPKVANPNSAVHSRQGGRIAAIRWALRDDRVQTTSVRMVDADQLDENLRAMEGSYSAADGALLAAYTDSVSPILCRMCGACDGRCPKGVQVADAVRSVMYAESYANERAGRSVYARAVRNVRCSDCGSCPVGCINGVDVRERLIRAEELFG